MEKKKKPAFTFLGFVPNNPSISTAITESSGSLPIPRLANLFSETTTKSHPAASSLHNQLAPTDAADGGVSVPRPSAYTFLPRINENRSEELLPGGSLHSDCDLWSIGTDTQKIGFEGQTAKKKNEFYAQIADAEFEVAKTHAKNSAAGMKDFAMNMSVEDFYSFECNASCPHKGSCVKRVCKDGNLDDVFATRGKLWNTKEGPAPSCRERGDRLFALQMRCWCPAVNSSDFTYSFQSDSTKPATQVCEDAYMHFLGFRNRRSQQFDDNKKIIKAGGDGIHSLNLLIIFAPLHQ